jgi:hypothetical protein
VNWLTWRQYRAQAIAGYAAIAMIVAYFIVTGLEILHSFASSGLEACLERTGADCLELASEWSGRFTGILYPLPFVLAVPALLGMFWGAPLVARELEHGTHRLVWTQGVTRGRWLTSKLAIVLGSAVVASGLLTLVMTWWQAPFVDSGRWERLGFGVFDLQGVVPVAYTIFAVALGASLGALFRKTLPAMFTTLVMFGVVRTAIVLFVREHYMSPLRAVIPLTESSYVESGSRDWVISSEVVDGAGHVLGGEVDLGSVLAERCPDLISFGKVAERADFLSCVDRIGLVTAETYHPDERFWIFQGIEAGIFLALAAMLVAFVVWRIKRLS